jgi:hypothetical protein
METLQDDISNVKRMEKENNIALLQLEIQSTPLLRFVSEWRKKTWLCQSFMSYSKQLFQLICQKCNIRSISHHGISFPWSIVHSQYPCFYPWKRGWVGSNVVAVFQVSERVCVCERQVLRFNRHFCWAAVVCVHALQHTRTYTHSLSLSHTYKTHTHARREK